MAKSKAAERPEAKALREFALGLPEAYEEFPWGERVAKVKGKVFVFLGKGEGEFGLSVKLPQSAMLALGLPFASPTAYGLGRAGWITARFGPRDKPPLDLLRAWIDESYRAVAPKKLVAALAAAGQVSTAGRTSASAKRPRARKSR